MKIKSIVMAVIAASTFGAGAATVTKSGMLKEVAGISKSSASAQKSKVKLATLQDKASQASYFKANEHEGTKRYIVRLRDSAVSSYKGDIAGYEKTNSSIKRSGLNNGTFNSKSAESLKYASYLEQKQSALVAKVASKLGFTLPSIVSYKYAMNGMLTELTYTQAQAVSKMSDVAFISLDKVNFMDTDTGPLVIGAPAVWNGTAGTSEYMGEGLIIGDIDSGVNTDHRSFAATGDDGYTVVNPLGEDNYLGDCVAEPSLCNSKLIGVYSYAVVTDVYTDPVFDPANQRPANGEDYGGHGSHTMSTAGGNVLRDVSVPQVDPYSGNTGDGVATGYVIDQMSGVAPHANLISYQVCWPGNNGDAHSGCPFSATLQAIDQAIIDGVDVLNYSIGSGDASPWEDAVDIGFLNANAAGIFVATSSGNAGPGPETSRKAAPWYTVVGATTSGAGSPDEFTGLEHTGKTIGTFTGGDTAAPADMTGGGTNLGFTGEIVYAGDFDNPNDVEGDDSAQCLTPFPADTFTATQIVVCDRGALARTEKAENVVSGGAGGYVLANASVDDTMNQDFYQVPGVQITFDDGVALKAWLASGTGHTATIGAGNAERLTNMVDRMASFSSRGANTSGGVIVPSIAAPGAAIFAATADENPFHNVNTPQPADFNFYSGTSMSTPHITGAGILVKQANPTWNPDQIRSALMMTSTADIMKEDGETPADPLDMGSGRAQVDKAINAGLVMSETPQNYFDANPGSGGDPTTLNVPSMTRECASTCVWTRTFEVVTAGTYTLTAGSAALTMDTASFDGEVGELVAVEFTLDVTSLDFDETAFNSVTITSGVSPDLHLPIVATSNKGTVPDDIAITVGRNNGSWSVTGLDTIATDNLSFAVDGIYDLNATGLTEVLPFELAQDPTNNTIAGLLDIEAGGLFHYQVDVPANTTAFRAAISEAPDNDFDLYIMQGNNIIVSQADGASNESVEILAPDAGSYLVVVQNWAALDALDSGVLTVEVIPTSDPLPGLTIDAPETNDGATDIRLVWDIDMVEGDAWGADVTAMVDGASVGEFNVRIDRVVDDFTATSDIDLVQRGDQIEYTLRLNSSPYQEAIDYSVAIEMPENMTMLEGSISGGGVITPNGEQGFTWETSSIVPFAIYDVSSSVDDASCAAAAFGGYFALEGIIPTSGEVIGRFGEAGDTVEIAAYGDREYNHYGNASTGLTITDDGLVYFSGSAGSPWNNASIPNESEPNDMIASLWKDQQVFDNGTTRGIRIATNGPDMDVIDFDEMGSYNDPADSFSYELIILRNSEFDYVVAYSDTQVGDLSGGAVAGVENADGTVGSDASSLIAAGTQVCYKLNAVTSDPIEVTFTVITQPGYAGQTAAPNVTVTSSMASTEDLTFRAAPVEFVNVAPIADAGADMTYDRQTPPTLIVLSASGSTDLDGDSLTYDWSQIDGDTVVLTAGLAGDPNVSDVHFNFASAANGVYRFSVTVSDGEFSSTDEVTVTIEGEEKNGGDGSMGLLLLLIVGSLFTRRKLKS